MTSQNIVGENLRSIGYLATTFFMYDLALSLSGIFLPVYYLDSGLPLNQILLLLLITFLVIGIVPTFLLTLFPQHFERTMTFGILSATLFFLALLVSRNPIILGLTYGLFNAAFWPSFNLLTFRSTESMTRATTISFLTVLLPAAAGIVGPLIGGYLIENFDFSSVFYLGGILMIMAAMTSLKVKVQKTDVRFEFPQFSKSSPLILFVVVFVAGSLTEYYWLGYPLLLYRLTSSMFDLGVLASLTSLLSSASAVLIGRISDLKGRRIEFGVISAAAASLYFVGLAFIKAPIQLLPVSVIGGIAIAFATPSIALLADSFERKDYASILVIRELFIMVGRFGNVFIMFLFIVSYQFQNYFLALAVLTAFTIPLYLSFRFSYGLR